MQPTTHHPVAIVGGGIGLLLTQAIQTQNQQFAIGQIGQSPTNGPVELTFPVSTQGRLSTPEEFENIILRASSTGAVMAIFWRG